MRREPAKVVSMRRSLASPALLLTLAVGRFRFSAMRECFLFGLLVGAITLSACAPLTSNDWTPNATALSPSATQITLALTPEPVSEPYIIVDITMNVRNGPGTEFDVIGQIPPQKKYPVIGKNVDWWLVDLGNNQSGWVYAPINETRFVGNAKAVSDVASPPTPTPIIIPACTPANTTETPSEGMEKARNTLVSFFELLNHRGYKKAAALYGGEYRILRDWNPLLDPHNHAALLANGCEINGLQCLRIKHIVDERVVSLAEYHFTVEFMNKDGSLFVRGPCCGANATDMPPQSQFGYTVVRDCTGKFLVLDLPVYVP